MSFITAYDHYGALFGDQEVMGKYATGQTKARDDLKALIKDQWVKRSVEGDPYAGLAAFKKDTDDFLGRAVCRA